MVGEPRIDNDAQKGGEDLIAAPDDNMQPTTLVAVLHASLV
jgi:hypothetical protein